MTGNGERSDLEILRRAADTMEKTSLCSLGQAASNPIVSSLRYFLSEYESHIDDKFCQTAECTALFNYTILPERCTGCGLCLPVCASGAIQGVRKETHTLDISKCIKCRSCVNVCARNAIIGIPVDSVLIPELSTGTLI